ncbi:MAG TPA: hypothetical protein VHO25_09275 [Polyangiaceae bacterium]|nr:hypothetical protein [Polyangiaceae bacterium]
MTPVSLHRWPVRLRTGLHPVVLATLCWVNPGAAQTPSATPLQHRAFQRPHPVVAFDAGVLLMPGADVCLRPENCTDARPSLLLSAWPMYRMSERFAFGAGLGFGWSPKHEVIDLSSRVPRTHSSNIFMAEGTARYLPVTGSVFEAWLGGTTGFVVLNDRFKIEQNQPEQHFVGESGSSISSEALAIGLAGGMDWALGSGFRLGGMLRGALWFLPSSPKQTALGDTASLDGVVPIVGFGLTVGYGPE